VKNREKTGFGSTGPSAGLLIDVFFCWDISKLLNFIFYKNKSIQTSPAFKGKFYSKKHDFWKKRSICKKRQKSELFWKNVTRATNSRTRDFGPRSVSSAKVIKQYFSYNKFYHLSYKCAKFGLYL
jgi:hypothetical protein